MNGRETGDLSLDAIMREVREALDRPPRETGAAPPRKSAVGRLVELIFGRRAGRA